MEPFIFNTTKSLVFRPGAAAELAQIAGSLVGGTCLFVTDPGLRGLGLCDPAIASLEKAGIHIIETRISHLAYSPEIAQAMLRRQQAHAIIAARRKIVEGAVGMVEQALEELSRKQILELDEERKASMVSNLLVVLCSEHETQPVVNTGSLYS